MTTKWENMIKPDEDLNLIKLLNEFQSIAPIVKGEILDRLAASFDDEFRIDPRKQPESIIIEIVPKP